MEVFFFLGKLWLVGGVGDGVVLREVVGGSDGVG
jgi:hypothetical protein